MIHVDNCCSTKRMLRLIFGDDVLIKLDVFHWLKRWDKMLAEPNSEQAVLFRVLMSRAMFQIQPNEYRRIQDELKEKYKREPTNKEILRAGNSIIPEPNILRRNVMAVVKFISFMDLRTELELSCLAENDETEVLDRPPKFFKDCPKIRNKTLANQFLHIDNNCLLDPPACLVQMHRINPENGLTFSAPIFHGHEWKLDNYFPLMSLITAVLTTSTASIALAVPTPGMHEVDQHNTTQFIIFNGAVNKECIICCVARHILQAADLSAKGRIAQVQV